jgi:hypothetical protein
MTACTPLAEHYEAWAAEMTEDVPFYVELAPEAGRPVVELTRRAA